MDYRVNPIGKTCAATGKPLEPGSRVHSVLVERNGVSTRLDYSMDGWSGPPADAIGYWRAVIPWPAAEAHKPLDTEALLDYFQRVLEDANPVQAQMAYVLALLLLQKRRLSLDGSRTDGDVAYLLLSGSRGEGPFEVRDQQLAAAEITSLQAQLTQHLRSTDRISA
ncbi:MAG: hypothetical protein KF861_13280 [Planctomycetaceae bacterium]|nr:hypothetical protein [Planctomycetaceae bacterium]